jgi:hypothetical protein
MRCSPLRPLFIRCAFGGKAQNGQHKSIETARAKRFSCLVVVRETDPNSPVLYNGKCPVDIDCYTAPKKYVQHILRCNPWVLSTGYTCFYLFICLPFFLIFHQLL